MGQIKVCDKCGRPIDYAPDCNITIYIHPYGTCKYELCKQCEEKLKIWIERPESNLQITGR